jgi:hypothetical protein
MAIKSRETVVDVLQVMWPLGGQPCQCLAEFFREEFLKHHQCLEMQREYFSDLAIAQAEDALRRILEHIDQLCQRDDAPQVVADLLKQLDAVTNLSAFTELKQLH